MTAQPIDIGFNSRYLLDIADEIEGEGMQIPARGFRGAHADARYGRCAGALRADADAGVVWVAPGRNTRPTPEPQPSAALGQQPTR